jgi:chromosomal replication initiation ATPase DnaA
MESQTAERYEGLKAVARVVKGDDRYARTVFERSTGPEVRRGWSVEQIARTAAKRAGADLEDLRGRTLSGERSRVRAMTGFVASRHCRIPLTKAAEFFHRDRSTLVRDLRRLESELAGRQELRDEIAGILSDLDGS